VYLWYISPVLPYLPGGGAALPLARNQCVGLRRKGIPSIEQLPDANKDARTGRGVTEFPGMVHCRQ
jgi:hypothetical protein